MAIGRSTGLHATIIAVKLPAKAALVRERLLDSRIRIEAIRQKTAGPCCQAACDATDQRSLPNAAETVAKDAALVPNFGLNHLQIIAPPIAARVADANFAMRRAVNWKDSGV